MCVHICICMYVCISMYVDLFVDLFVYLHLCLAVVYVCGDDLDGRGARCSPIQR